MRILQLSHGDFGRLKIAFPFVASGVAALACGHHMVVQCAGAGAC
jgi:hypothetical protein